MTLVVIPFALKPARSGSMATSIMASLMIGFSYYAVHSLAISLGRAEILPPLAAAWATNMLMGAIGAVLLLGAESPS
jgi:lipopolysaccharide export system permease protein